MKIIKQNVSTGKERVLAECATITSAKALQKAYIKEMYDLNQYNDYIIYIK